jgi:hypothetical protein
MFSTTKITVNIPLILRQGTESYITDKFRCKVINTLKINPLNALKTSYWELSLFHENGKPLKLINEVSMDERMLIATFSGSFYKKHRLLEMFAAS